MMNEDARFPLSPMLNNVPVGSEPPPLSLELPGASFTKGENSEVLAPAVSRSGSAVPTEESRSPLTRLPENSLMGSGGARPPSAELFYKGEPLDADLGEGAASTAGGSQSEASESPSPAPDLDLLESDAAPLEDAPSGLCEDTQPTGGTLTVCQVSVDLLEADLAHSGVQEEVDTDAESAIHALLALQREPSPSTPRSRGSSPEPYRRRPLSPSRQGAIVKGPGAEASRYFCKYPRCGKAYASTDAVRKHCRQRHLDWLRRLGHGCPALYCRWEE